ncbi:helix-turn-helix domain-containing protein [Alicyclobacillus suci]|uniref:helix-turn-helix domain-containing protein n=1 Tax=Alicyclobacillus suci TaxID=2816080 RepID=UPI001A8E881A|nr:helix-turn-helix transcriptional regulator [Alicyclobacillus suci]
MTTTGENIASLRKALGLTQAKLAKQAGISTSAVAMYETNRRQPDEATIRSLAAALGTDVRDLIGSAEADNADANAKLTPKHSASPAGATKENSNETSGASKKAGAVESGWTNLALSREEARFILFMRMHPDALPFIQEYMTADTEKRKQIEKAWRLIQAFQT